MHPLSVILFLLGLVNFQHSASAEPNALKCDDQGSGGVYISGQAQGSDCAVDGKGRKKCDNRNSRCEALNCNVVNVNGYCNKCNAGYQTALYFGPDETAEAHWVDCKDDGCVCARCPINNNQADCTMDSKPAPCPPDQYYKEDTNGGGSCTNCPGGTPSSPAGSTKLSDCVLECKANAYEHYGRCSNCPSGKSSLKGSKSRSDCGAEPKIGLGKPCSSDGKCDTGVCRQKCCIKGTGVCDECKDTGFSIFTSSGQCIKCPANYYLSSSKCRKCPGESKAPAGSASKKDCKGNGATAAGENCEKDADCQSSACKGTACCTTNAAKGGCLNCKNTKLFATAGSCAKCAANYYLSSGACTKCEQNWIVS